MSCWEICRGNVEIGANVTLMNESVNYTLKFTVSTPVLKNLSSINLNKHILHICKDNQRYFLKIIHFKSIILIKKRIL
jgi:hypothetical protein